MKVKKHEIIRRILKEEQFFWMFVGEDNYKLFKLQICYGEYLWLLAVKHKKKDTEVDSLLEGKCL